MHSFCSVRVYIKVQVILILKNLLKYLLVTSARSKGKTPKYIFVERCGVARSVRNRKLIA